MGARGTKWLATAEMQNGDRSVVFNESVFPLILKIRVSVVRGESPGAGEGGGNGRGGARAEDGRAVTSTVCRAGGGKERRRVRSL